MENREPSTRLTLESMRELFKIDEPDVEITSLDEEPGSGRGDNYTSMLYRVQVNGRKRIEYGEWAPWKRAIIYKILPDSRERREAFKSELLFHNEMIFYTKVWPALDELQARGNPVFSGVAKVYAARPDLIAMEDLRVRGFKMADRRKGLTVEELRIILKSLAGFHALSLALRELKPDVFERLSKPGQSPVVQEALFREENEDWYRQYYRVATSRAIKMVSDGMTDATMERKKEVIDRLQGFLNEDVFFRTMCELTSTQGPLTVFCHGDCWINNILLRDEVSTDNELVYFIDFQLTRVGSLALDLANLLYCCTSGDIRKTHMIQLLQHYHRHLMSALYTLNPSAEPARNPAVMWNLLNEEMRRCGRFGLGLALDILPISTCASDQAPDVYEEATSNEDNRSRAPPKGGAACTRLMTDLVLELIHNRAL